MAHAHPPHAIRLLAGLALAGVIGAALAQASAQAAGLAPLQTDVVQAQGVANALTLAGTVEARLDARVAAQVPGRITAVLVKAGDTVAAGQALLRIDAAVAEPQWRASQAQQAQAEAQQRLAQAEWTRAQALQAQGFISPAALDQARARWQAAQAGAEALRAQAQASGAQVGWHVVKAPYAGRVSQVMVSEGDLAAPGVALLQLFAPQGLRVAVSVPEAMAAYLDLSVPAQVSLPAVAGNLRWTATQLTLLPGLDALTHAATVRVELPAAAARAAEALGPGQVAQVQLAVRGDAPSEVGAALSVPKQAVVRRGEVQAVYVVDAQGVPRLRQVRLGRAQGSRIQVVAGLQAGERVASDPLAAARRVP